MIVLNILNRAMLHDPEVYPDADEFKPERFLRTNADGNHEIDPTILDPRTIAFGFGRRCVSFYFCSHSFR
jgi:cytochrome P450